MQLSTARKIALSMKIAFGAGLGFLTVGNLPAAVISGVFAYSLVVSLPVPNLPFRESLRVNWRAFCLVGGMVALGILYFCTKMPEAEVAMRCFAASFWGVICGEIFSNPLIWYAKRPEEEEENTTKSTESDKQD